MIKSEDKTMTKKQYFIPQTETMPLFHSSALCASATPTPTGDEFSIGGPMDPGNAM